MMNIREFCGYFTPVLAAIYANERPERPERSPRETDF
jgi:hypothetical protein